MDNSINQKNREKNAEIITSRPYIGKKITMRVDVAKYTDGASRYIEIVEHPGAVLIIPITSNGNIIFIKQYRTVIDKILIELPAGTLEKMEDPLDCAQRELREETGFKANRIIKLSGFYPAPGFCTEYIHVFLATDLVPGKLQQDDDEGIDPIELSLDEACDMINENIIIDAKTIVSIFKYMKWLNKI